ncbi:MAG: MBL fold metallo-hydrolase [Mediterranea massiliensis]|nr:MBL fold metallo-hydrolase [Mediterranea massiliensis]
MKTRTVLWIATIILTFFASCANHSNAPAKLTPIPDNAQPRLMPASLFTAAPDSIIKALGLQEGIPSSVSVFLLEKDDMQILFDTGNGAPDSQLLPTLEKNGWKTADIDCIFITHLHGDHVGGLLSGEKAVFEQAILYIPAKEYVAWMAMPEERNRQLKLIEAAYGKRFVKFDLGTELPGGVTAIAAYGHTPGHTVYQVGDKLIVGDIMHGVALQLKHPEICARFDMDGEQAITARKQIIEKARKEKLTMYGMHFPAPYYLK